MKLIDFLNSIPATERNEFSERVGHSFDYLRQIAYGNRVCQESTAIALDRESDGAVSIFTLCPNTDWDHVSRRTRTPKPPADKAA